MAIYTNHRYKNIDRGTWLYHKDLAPKGKLFSSEVARTMDGKDGWEDSPGKATRQKDSIPSAQPVNAVEEAVKREVGLFVESVREAVETGVVIPNNDAFWQMNEDEIRLVIKLLDPAKAKTSAIKKAEKDHLQTVAVTLFSAHNAKVTGEDHG